MAQSALSTNSSLNFASLGQAATLILMESESVPEAKGVSTMPERMRSATSRAPSSEVSMRMAANSSPPYLATRISLRSSEEESSRLASPTSRMR